MTRRCYRGCQLHLGWGLPGRPTNVFPLVLGNQTSDCVELNHETMITK